MNRILIMCEGPNEKTIMDFGENVELLVKSIKTYQRLKGKSHQKDEHCLGELLK